MRRVAVRKNTLKLNSVKLRTLLAVGLSVSVAACFGGPPDPADIKPVFRVMNSPRPVPSPRWNPRRDYAQAGAPVRRQTATNQSRPDRPRPARSAPARQQTAATPQVTGQTVTVQRGDTLYSLARKSGVPLQSLIAANNIKPPYALAVGQKLNVPVSITHTVRRGETGYGISRRYGVNLASLMKLNGVRKPYTLSVGQVLKLPGGARPASTQTASNSTPARGRTVPVPQLPARSSSGFGWPLEGRLASRFGPKEGGLHNDGINILAGRGTPVRSADAGVVVYASNALEGYGNLLLLKHAGGWLTAYAHNERLLVNKGDSVKKGQVIARVGDTGGVTEPQLHFEIRKGRRALDPLDYLAQRTAQAR
ncbi:MAG: M23 family metallopeptidase [Kordiimonadaceae bacterium]|nr:M23 family metallopeptidase [Kordiimonadaceae bacterium]MBO6570606.1 M23 family metallopeptidase [Kordiimonadaceae bacterium]MBO6966536.1 M23 family metallopeptidase [Kordiimonadaceae bacterium]